MNRREKIFVFAAAAAACFGLMNLFLLSPQGRTIGGTSLDKDGTGTANPESVVQAIHYAIKFSMQNKD